MKTREAHKIRWRMQFVANLAGTYTIHVLLCVRLFVPTFGIVIVLPLLTCWLREKFVYFSFIVLAQDVATAEPNDWIIWIRLHRFWWYLFCLYFHNIICTYIHCNPIRFLHTHNYNNLTNTLKYRWRKILANTNSSKRQEIETMK